VIVSTSISTQAAQFKTSIVTCPAATPRVLAGGYHIEFDKAGDRIQIDESFPSSTSAWTVSGHSQSGPDTWGLEVYAICAP
jgi:hypothetical protein